MLRTKQNLPFLSPTTRFISPVRTLTCLPQSRVRLLFFCSSPGLTNHELWVADPEGWSACSWSTMAGDRSDRDSKSPTSGKVIFLLFKYWLLPCHGFEHLWSANPMDQCMAMGSCKYSTTGQVLQAFLVEFGAQIWTSRDLEGDMGTNLIWTGNSRDVQCLCLCGTLGLTKDTQRQWTVRRVSREWLLWSSCLSCWHPNFAEH